MITRPEAGDASPSDTGWVRRYVTTRETTLSFAAPLSPEDCAIQSLPDASPVKWHLAHTTWFFETFVLTPHVSEYCVFDAHFRVLFNSYYVGVGERPPRSERGLLSRPSLEEVLAYRRHVDSAMYGALERGQLGPDALALVELGLNHEQQHQELLLTDVKHLLSRNPLAPVYSSAWPLTSVRATTATWRAFEGGLREIGHTGAGFAFDNEGPRHRVWLEPFELSSVLVTHGDFLAFVEDRGYERPELWLSAGWDAVQSRGWNAPLYWSKHAGEWRTFTLHGDVAIDPATPICHVSFFEAEAFARWKGARMPTESEWEVAAHSVPIAGNLLESRALHPLAARGDFAAGELSQVFGDVWEWTRSDYAPYPGFAPAAGAVAEYNGKFMCNQYVLRGGSCATPVSHIRASYRNFFAPDARWQFSGLRLAR
ncbi:MAG: ergothioneine biosynthesis protein EgtB [Planctomycetota bacterium]|mgnify:CR=1 FL=1|nr:ergothioneine biosynthesis protein EgtB [Planctomycetota bacterium]